MLCSFGFVDDVTIERIGQNQKMTRMFRPDSKVAAPGAKSAVSVVSCSKMLLRSTYSNLSVTGLRGI